MHSARCAEQALLTESRPWQAEWPVPEPPWVPRLAEVAAQPWELLRAAAVEQPLAQPSERKLGVEVAPWVLPAARPWAQREVLAQPLVEPAELSEEAQLSAEQAVPLSAQPEEQLSVVRAVPDVRPAAEPSERLLEARPLAELSVLPSSDQAALLAQR